MLEGRETTIGYPPLDPAERTRCEIWTRVMGYHRPVGCWNQGKQQEHRDRKQFHEPSTAAHCQAADRYPLDSPRPRTT